MAATGRCHPASLRFHRSPKPLESRPDMSSLPPSVRSILEKSKTPGIMTGRVRSHLTGHNHSPVQLVSIVFARSDAGTSSDRTLNSRVRSLHRSRFTSCELTRRWTSESGAASDHSFSSKSSKSFELPVPNQVPTSIRSK